MILSGNGRLCWQTLLVFFYVVDGYELLSQPIWNWTSAAVTFTKEDNLLARITSIEELCKAQAEAQRSFNYGYWTALKRNSMGVYHWGRLANNSANVTEELLEKSQPVDRCYVINKSAMKLLSRDCDSLQGVLLSFTDYKDDNSSSFRLLEHYSDGCIEYELSKCLKLDVVHPTEVFPQPWSCKRSNGMSYGSCQVEEAILKCCRTYCQAGNHTYTVDTTSGMDTKVRKIPKGYTKDVQISFNTSDNNKEKKEVKVIITSQVFNNTERVLAVLLHRTTGDQEFKLTNTSNFVLYSDVVGVVLEPAHKEIIPNKVIIYFSHNKPKANQRILERKCVFWKEDFNTLNGSWSSEGCTVLNNSSSETTICGCNHLTNFAVLMQFKDVEDGNTSEKHKVTLLVITYVGCALSLIGEVLTVFMYVVFMKFKAEGIQIRINLAIALFFAQVVFLSGIDATNNKPVCVLVAVLLHYLYLASFGWMLLEGVFLYIMIVEVFSTVNVRFLYLFAWGYPVIPVVISLAIGADDNKGLQNYTNENFCWLSFYKHLSWAFIVPVLLVTLINFAILMAVLREIRNLHEPNPSKMKTFKKSLKSFVILTPLLGLTWVFGMLAATDAGLVFQYIFTILNSTQGMLIFLLHVLRNSDVRTAFHHKLLKWRFDRFYSSTSVNRIQGDVLQSKGKRKRQIDPEESNNKELHSTRQSGEQMVLSVMTEPAVSSGSVT